MNRYVCSICDWSATTSWTLEAGAECPADDDDFGFMPCLGVVMIVD